MIVIQLLCVNSNLLSKNERGFRSLRHNITSDFRFAVLPINFVDSNAKNTLFATLYKDAKKESLN